jgi:hypothetical protein
VSIEYYDRAASAAWLIANEAPPQTDEVYRQPLAEDIGGFWSIEVDSGRACREMPWIWELFELGGSEDPWTTGARDEHSTIGGGRVA